MELRFQTHTHTQIIMCKNSSFHEHYRLANELIDEWARVSRNPTNKKRELPKIALLDPKNSTLTNN